MYVIDFKLYYLFRKLRSSIDNTSESNDKLNNEESDDHDASAQRSSPDKKNTQDALSEDMDLYKRIQVLQQINPAIKALMNYRGKRCRPNSLESLSRIKSWFDSKPSEYNITFLHMFRSKRVSMAKKRRECTKKIRGWTSLSSVEYSNR